jgi:hypothetical protein
LIPHSFKFLFSERKTTNKGSPDNILQKKRLQFTLCFATLTLIKRAQMKGIEMFNAKYVLGILLAGATMCLTGCVERRLTIVTEPSDAVVWLNDEEIGVAPVTVGFNWYGDYNVRIEKPGYEILNTHRVLERPMHDRFPFDFFAEVLWPRQIEDSYTWNFQLQPYEPTPPAELIESAHQMRERTDNELGKIAVEILSKEKK